MAKLDFTKVPEYAGRQMFLDPAGPVTIQRYDDFRYQRMVDYVKAQRGAFWIPDEVTLLKDRIDYEQASEAMRFIFTMQLLRQTALDSEQGRAPAQVFTPVCSLPEAEAWALWWTAFEQIHSESYSHIIRNIYQVSKDQFNSLHSVDEILGMLSGIDKYYHELHVINSKKVVRDDLLEKKLLTSELDKVLYISEHDHIKAIYKALIASYGLEAVRFMVSFTTSLAMNENKLFMGNGNIIKLILADETLHTEATAWMINTVVKDDYRFREVAHELKNEARDMLVQVVDEEKKWANFQFQKGNILDLTETNMCNHVDRTASIRFGKIGVNYATNFVAPIYPWFESYLDSNSFQAALQETEGTDYLVDILTTFLDVGKLPTIIKRY
jgi:ribonucleoside-diphosphate reductase beta chain